MSADDLVKLECRTETLIALASGLERFGPVTCDPDWLVSAMWLCTASADYLATSSTQVLADGYIARPLVVDRADEFLRQLKGDLPDISGRLIARQSGLQLPEAERPMPPSDLRPSPSSRHSTDVVVRVSERASAVHRVACALLFGFDDGSSLLVGTDIATLAMVVSDDRSLIDRYAEDCEVMSADAYVRRYCA